MAAIATPEGPRVIGRYSLHGEIASGGMAVVHFGRLLGPVGFARTVAIKRLHPHLAKDPGFRAMFLDEARLAARVRHPNVVPILDVLEEDDELYLVMEYVHGETLDRLVRGVVKRKQPVPIGIAVAVVRDALFGLHAAHEAKSERGTPLGIVHRDVSPQNVLVGVDGVARVHDFGVAKAQARIQLTTEGQLKGKIAYMAPEQVEHAGVDRRADIWSAGVVLWEALTRKRLFLAEHPAQLMKVVLSQPIPKPSQINPEIPRTVDRIVMRALERDRDERFETAREMAVELDGVGVSAAQHAVSSWVEEIAKELLERRTLAISEIESSLTGPNAPLAPPSSPPPVAETQTLVATSLSNAETRIATENRVSFAPRRRWLPFALVAVIAAALGASAMTLVKSSPPTSPAEPATSEAPPSARPEPAHVPSVLVETSPAPSSSAPPVAKKTAPATRRPSAPVPQPAKNDCNPPYTLDKEGVRVPKLRCLTKP